MRIPRRTHSSLDSIPWKRWSASLAAITLLAAVGAALPNAALAQARITGPKIFGVRPGHPVLFSFTAVGDAPFTWSASNLPSGVTLNSNNGQLSGTVAQRGTYLINVTATGATTSLTRTFRLVVGDTINLTPPIGWNGYNRYGVSITDTNIRAQTDAMVSQGLFDHGFSYVNLDEGWEGTRSTSAPYDNTHPGPIQGSATKFPNMQSLGTYIHSKNLKFGIYTVPMDMAYQGYIGSAYFTGVTDIGMLPQDIQQFSDWGVDYLKLDGIFGGDQNASELSFAITNGATRDITLSASDNAGVDINTYATLISTYQNAWRTGYDLSGGFGPIVDNLLIGYTTGRPGPSPWAAYTGPGHWADSDMLVVGILGDNNGNTSPTPLTQDEQKIQVTQVAMIASPFLFGGDIVQLDTFTKSLLTNDELLDINQDPLGIQATIVSQNVVKNSDNTYSGTGVWSRPLEDGSLAVAFYNCNSSAGTVSVNWSDLGITGSQSVRDLWAHQDLGTFSSSFSPTVNAHGVVVVKITPTSASRPQITVEPINADNIAAGSSATFSVTATGAGLQYQWYKNKVAISGATSSSYTTPALDYVADATNKYRCKVTGSAGTVWSYQATLNILGTAGINIARGRPVITSSKERVQPGTGASIVDGNATTYWQSVSRIDPQWVVIDLGSTYNISRVKVAFDYAVAQDFDIQVAPDGADKLSSDIPWTTVSPVRGNSTLKDFDFTGLSASGRYVRMKGITHIPFDPSSYFIAWLIDEIEVYGTPSGGTTPTAATPTFSPAGGTYTSAQSVTLGDTTSGAAIHYTTDGSTPTASSQTYSAAIAVSATQTIKAIATASGYNNSSVASATYTINISGGSIVANGSFEAPALGASNYQYTPTGASWTFAGNAGIESNGSAWGASNAPDGTQTAFLQGNPGQGPTLGSITQSITFPTAGTYILAFQAARRGSQVQPVQVSLDGTNQGSTVTPASSAFSAQSVTLTVASAGAHTLKLAATVNSGDNSTFVDQVTLTAVTPTAATPTFSPAGGTYTSAQSVTLSDTTSGAAIHYTTDGSTPTASSPTYTAAIAVSATQTIKAIATASGYNTSAVASATYTINISGGPNLVTNPGYESGLNGWFGGGTYALTTTSVHSGTNAVQNSGSYSAVFQTITGLQSNHAYTLTVWAKAANTANHTWIFVNNFGGTEIDQFITTTGYSQYTIHFTTGASATSAQIGEQADGLASTSCVDDWSVN